MEDIGTIITKMFVPRKNVFNTSVSPQQTKCRETVYFSFLIVTLITNAVSNINTSNYTQEQLSQIYDILCLYTYIEIEKKKRITFIYFNHTI